MNYTKGKWEVVFSDTACLLPSSYGHYDQGSGYYIEAGDEIICTVNNEDYDDQKGYNGKSKKAEANAHLIAASPRMADLLERLVNNGWNASISEEAKEILQTLA